jgi:catechol 2,3-dioxygenase-like lactoylglutathione lyase family enzyme
VSASRSTPQPLAGRFHEFSIATGDVRTCVEFYERLGFTHAATSDAVRHPYGVLSDGRLYVGVHQRRLPSPTLTFVRAGLRDAVAEFAAAGIELTASHLGEEEFNEVACSDPYGQALAVLEARTYSPVARARSEVSLCGEFAHVSLPAADFTAARAFWERLGFVALEEVQQPYRHQPLVSDALNLAFHAPATLAQPLLVFTSADMAARLARLRELGLPLSPPPGALATAANALLYAPDGTALLLLQSED